jgi:hypothetical protein
MHDITRDDAIADVLVRAGYDVVRCAAPDEEVFPCAGAGGSCPLDGSVDVAVVVHDRPAVELSVGEVGVVCAMRDGIPVVLAGNHTQSPFGERVDAVALDASDVPAACRRAIAAVERRASDFVGAFAGVDADVTRHGHSVSVRLGTGASDRQAVLAHQAATRLYPNARRIDVGRAGSAQPN